MATVKPPLPVEKPLPPEPVDPSTENKLAGVSTEELAARLERLEGEVESLKDALYGANVRPTVPDESGQE